MTTTKTQRLTIVSELLKERLKQIAKGFDENHDDEHGAGELRQAAAHLLSPSHVKWPWEDNSMSDKTVRERFVVAGAFIVAEIERYDRMIEKDRREKLAERLNYVGMVTEDMDEDELKTIDKLVKKRLKKFEKKARKGKKK